MSERTQLLQTLDETHKRLIAAALSAAEHGMKGPWGPREILGHAVGWEAVAIAYLPQLLKSNEPLERAINVGMATIIGNQSVEKLGELLHQVHQRFLVLPEVQDDASFVPGNPFYERTRAAIAHSLEHALELEHWQ